MKKHVLIPMKALKWSSYGTEVFDPDGEFVATTNVPNIHGTEYGVELARLIAELLQLNMERRDS